MAATWSDYTVRKAIMTNGIRVLTYAATDERFTTLESTVREIGREQTAQSGGTSRGSRPRQTAQRESEGLRGAVSPQARPHARQPAGRSRPRRRALDEREEGDVTGGRSV